MRGCLGFLLFAAAAVSVVALGLVELVLPVLVTAAVHDSPVVRGQPVDVHIETSLTGLFLHGQIDSIRITGTKLSEANATIGMADVTLSGVSIADHTFQAASGSLDAVTLTTEFGTAIPIQSVGLSGSSTRLLAEVRLTPAEAELAIRSRLEAAGLPSVTVTLGAGTITLDIPGGRVQAPLVTTRGSLVLNVGPPLSPIAILNPPASGEWRIETVDVEPAGVRLVLSIPLV